MKSTKMVVILAVSMAVFFSCKQENVEPGNDMGTIELAITGLEDLGSDFVYEGWLIVNGTPVTTGTFTVDGSGNLSKTKFELKTADIAAATKFVLSIEPLNDTDPAPSATKILAGDFTNSTASLDISPIGDFNNAEGQFILATPTNGSGTNENSGIWFLDLTTAGPAVGLTLPQLPEGWKYEGWVVMNGQPVTTGTFTNVAATDMAAPYSGNMPLPDVNGPDGFFPGEDFLNNAPANLTFPTDIAGGTAVISIEPSPDNSPNPFTLKPLVESIPANATDHVVYPLSQNLNFPTGTVMR